MKATLSTRLIIWVAVPAALLFGFVIWNASGRSFDRVAAQTEELSRFMARSSASDLEIILTRVSKIPAMIGVALETGHLDTTEKVESFLHDVLARNSEIYGSCIAFKPYGFDPSLNAYAPYYYRAEDGPKFEQLGKPEYNYFMWPWYREPRDEGEALWTEPYFDDGGGNTIMITYSVPFRRNELFWGIATIDIAMTQLIEQTQNIRVGRTGYAFIVSKQGRFLAFPDQAKIMQASIRDVNPELGERMLSGDAGFFRGPEPWQNRHAWIAYAPVQQGKLALAIVYPEDEALAEARELRTKLLATGLLGLLVLVVMLIVGSSRVDLQACKLEYSIVSPK